MKDICNLSINLKYKKVFPILLALTVMVACNKNQSGINNEDLQGTYDADFSSLLKQLLNEDEDMKEDSFALAFQTLSPRRTCASDFFLRIIRNVIPVVSFGGIFAAIYPHGILPSHLPTW